MRVAAVIVPTRRELVLLGLLFITLLCFVPSSYVSETTPFLSKANVLDRTSSDGGSDKQSVLSYPEPTLTWKESIPETRMLHHSPGWTILDQLYIFNGTIFIVTSTPDEIPELMYITSSGCKIENGREAVLRRRPSDKDIRVVTPDEAQQMFNTKIIPRLTGVSFLDTDYPQFIAHYYHMTAEILFGLWRTYTALDPFITADGHTTLPPPRRLMFRHVASSQWRDYAALNQWVIRGAFPSIGMEFSEDWADRADMQVPFVFDRIVIGDRAASYESEAYLETWRMTGSAFQLRGGPNWWTPLRKSVLEFSGLAAEWILGPTPEVRAQNEKYVITYVSRQDWGRRMLRQKDHEDLVVELYKLRDRYGYEVNVVTMDKLTRAEQIQLAGRTTILMGVHGNGLTSLVWMRPTPRSTVIEFFYPTGFATDYEFTTRALGMTHYGVWDNVTFTQPQTPRRQNYPDGFQGNDIPVNGAVVARLVHERLMLASEEPDSQDSQDS